MGRRRGSCGICWILLTNCFSVFSFIMIFLCFSLTPLIAMTVFPFALRCGAPEGGGWWERSRMR
ncbi:unnamed protein product [Tuber melanosporum]|uniref:(Perigord truffle) hypothetical protein n=1 Tax=Tuber melanosporum (strain Mel28) TaxID=656061 RepID=D5G4J5_TUBMM|nr:uncharacterized protein GSTUM_00004179001 [Tuber melanosporum]CAZ79438.1 unnamed protein product [Tuber melanosporum]